MHEPNEAGLPRILARRPDALVKMAIWSVVALVVCVVVGWTSGLVYVAVAILLGGIPVIWQLRPVATSVGTDGLSIGDPPKFYRFAEVEGVTQTAEATVLAYPGKRQLRLYDAQQKPLDDSALRALQARIGRCKALATGRLLEPERGDATLIEWVAMLLPTTMAQDRTTLSHLVDDPAAPIDHRAAAAALLRYSLDRETQAQLGEAAAHTACSALRAVFEVAAQPSSTEAEISEVLQRLDDGRLGPVARMLRRLRPSVKPIQRPPSVRSGA